MENVGRGAQFRLDHKTDKDLKAIKAKLLITVQIADAIKVSQNLIQKFRAES